VWYHTLEQRNGVRETFETPALSTGSAGCHCKELPHSRPGCPGTHLTHAPDGSQAPPALPSATAALEGGMGSPSNVAPKRFLIVLVIFNRKSGVLGSQTLLG